MGPDEVRLELSGVELTRTVPNRVLVQFRVTSLLGSFELEVLGGPVGDLNAAVADARRKVREFARHLGDAAAKPGP